MGKNMLFSRRLNRNIVLLALVSFAAHALALMGVLPGAMPALGDATGQFEPWHEFIRQSLHHRGEFPIWNPHIYCGLPFLSNGQSGLFYPPNALYYLLPENKGMWLFSYSHTLLLMLGMYFLGRTLGMKRRAAFLAAVLFGLGNATPGHLFGGHLTFLPVRMYWPWQTAFLLRLLRGEGRSNAFYLAACLALGLAAGAPQMWVFGILVCLGVLGVYCLRALSTDAGNQPSRGKVVGSLLLAAVLAALWCAPTLLPLRELKSWSSHGDKLSFEEVSTLAATPLSLFRLFFNGFFGGNSFVMWSLPSNPGEDAASLGFAAAILALLAPFLAPNSRTVRWVFAGSILTILLSQGSATPLYRLLYDHVLFFQITRVPARWLELWAFAAALLCGFSFDALLRHPQRAPLLQRFWIGGAVFTAILLVGSLLVQSPWQHGAQVVRQALHLPVEELAEMASSLQRDAVLTCLITFAVLIFLTWGWRDGLTRHAATLLVLRLLMIEPLTQFWLSTRVTPADYLKSVRVPTSIAQIHAPGERWIVRSAFGQMNSPFFSGIDTVNGYEPFGSAQFFEFANAADQRVSFAADFQPRRMDTLWRVAGASHLLWKPLSKSDQPKGFPGREVAHVGGWHLKELRDGLRPWPQAYLTSEVVQAPTSGRYATLQKLSGKPFETVPPVVVEPDFPQARPASSGGKVEPKIISPDVLRWNIEAPGDAVFVHQEAIAPGWSAYVDGKSVPLHRVNGFFRGVPIPTGSRDVALVYNSQTLRFALFLALCGIGFAVTAFTSAQRRGPRQPP